MTRRPRRNHSLAFKAKVALAAIKGEKTMVELSQQFDVHANQIKQWKDQLLEGAMNVFDDGRKEDAAPAVDVKNLHAKIGELTLENDFLAGALDKAGLWAESDDRPEPYPFHFPSGAGSRHQPWQCLFSASGDIGGGSGADAPD